MGITVGIVGTGAFAEGFIPLFRTHPDVDDLVLSFSLLRSCLKLLSGLATRQVLLIDLRNLESSRKPEP